MFFAGFLTCFAILVIIGLTVQDDEAASGRQTETAGADPSAAEVEELTEQIDANPGSVSLSLERARYHEDSYDLDKAIADYSAALELDPDNVEVLKLRAEAYEWQSEYKLAVDDYQRVLALEPLVTDNHINLARVLVYVNQLYSALETLTTAIEINSSDASLFVERSKVHRSRGETNAAINDITSAIKLDSEPHYYLVRSEFFSLIGDTDRALSDLDKAVQLDPTNSLPARARAHLEAGDIKDAFADYDEAIRLADLDPDSDGSSYLNRGDAYYSLNEYDLAISDYLEYEDEVGYLHIDHRLGFAYFHLGLWQQAKERLSAISEYVGSYYDADYYYPTDFYAYEYEFRYFDSGYSVVEPEGIPEVLYALAVSEAHLGEYERAIVALQKIDLVSTAPLDQAVGRANEIGSWIVELEAGRNPFES